MEKQETRTFVLPGEGNELARVLCNLMLVQEDNDLYGGIVSEFVEKFCCDLVFEEDEKDGDSCFERLESRLFRQSHMSKGLSEPIVLSEEHEKVSFEKAPRKYQAVRPAPAAPASALAKRVTVPFPVEQLCREARIALLTGEFLKQSLETTERFELDLSYLALMYAKAVEIEANARLYESVGQLPAPGPGPERLSAFMTLLNELAPLYGLEPYQDTARVRKAIQNSPANSSKGLGLRLAFDDHQGSAEPRNAELGCRLFLVQELRNGYIHHEILTSDWKLDNLRRAAFDTLGRLIA